MFRRLFGVRRLLLSSAIVVAVLALYFGSFLGLRRCTFVTFFDTDAAGKTYLRSPRVYYFAADPARNAFLYRFFYPLHCRSSGSVQHLQHRLHHQFGPDSPPLSPRYYVEDIRILTAAGLRIAQDGSA